MKIRIRRIRIRNPFGCVFWSVRGIGGLTRLNESGLTRVKCVGGLRELKHVILILILLVNGMIYC